MSEAARYLFDLDFSAPPEPEIEEKIEEIPPEPMITVAEHERLLAQAKQEAFTAGTEKALNEREQLASEQNLALQQKMLDDVTMIYAEVKTLMQRLERDASKLAFTFASRFAEKLVAKEPKTEILALLNQILGPLRQTPHISIRLNDAVAEEVKAKVDEQMSELGFTGKLTILPDPVIMPGDCEVEWVDGGIGRNMRSAIRQVEQLLEDHFSHVPEDEAADEDETGDPQDGDPQESDTAEAETPEADAPEEKATEADAPEREEMSGQEASEQTIDPDPEQQLKALQEDGKEAVHQKDEQPASRTFPSSAESKAAAAPATIGDNE
ncbi:FliH/SctL family protein [uncultured Cohaesibacter sp.]|uniref:FliH/SctL family protein n=1 Tax=uncultured Cohaesibacter sp. TaxID=1002546 RepID=UPI00292CC21A|nr:FliH/SctL family protein [uncultured Cohaesibacter sp.]